MECHQSARAHHLVSASSASSVLYVGANGNILRTRDGGTSYSIVFKTVDNRDTFSAAVAIPGVLLATGQYQNVNVLSRAEILIAHDDIASEHHWTNISGAWNDNGDYAVTTAIACPRFVFAGDEDGNFYTTRDPRAVKWSGKQFIGHSIRISTATCIGADGLWVAQYEDNGGVALLCVSWTAP